MTVRRFVPFFLLSAAVAAVATLSAPTADAKRAAPGAVAKDDPAPRVLLSTSMGDIVLELDRKSAPVSVANFLKYVDAGHYEGTIFHRVIDNFMIQGGGFDADMQQKKAGDPIQNESANGLKNERGTIAMARTSDPNSATAQFYINVKDNDFLNGDDNKPGYAVFGKVVEGMAVVDKIKKVETGTKRGMQNVPNENIVIKSAKRLAKQ